MRKIKNPFLGKQGYDCFGCSPQNPIGLHMEFYEDGDEVVSYWRPQEHYQGWVGVMHGGIIATVIDETAGWFVMRKMQTSGVTSRLNVKYVRPINISTDQLAVRAKMTELRGRYLYIDVVVENAEGKTCASASVVYCLMDKQKAQEMGFTTCEAEDEQLISM